MHNRPGVKERIPYQPRARRLVVTQVDDLSDTIRRIHLGGPELESEFPFIRMGVADHVKVAVPDAAFESSNDSGAGAISPDSIRGAKLALRTYTVRGMDAEQHELLLDFVCHPQGGVGDWAQHASAGDHLLVMGPRGNTVYDDGYDAYVVAVDATGLPAAARWLEETPPECHMEIIVLLTGPQAEATVDSELHLGNINDDRPYVSVRIVTSDSEDFVRHIKHAIDSLPGKGRSLLWAAGEAKQIAAIRSLTAASGTDDGLEVSLHGYWKEGQLGYHEGHGAQARDASTDSGDRAPGQWRNTGKATAGK